ncbi:MAG TPA: hypothetical protein VG247_34650 [Pseudonocardiaceae bacterium]|jgi:WD40 repeat protein|nr:hypothetical protein [Pseudonocardiaceae bacterium]
MSADQIPNQGVHLQASAADEASIHQAGRDQHFHYADGAHQQRRARSGPVAPECPYPGLAAFGPEQARWFFGRDRLIAELTARLDQRLRTGGLQMVVAPSGAGKSSLLRAGLLPRLDQAALPGSDRWPKIVVTPTANPLWALAASIARLTGARVDAVVQEFAADPSRCLSRLSRALRGRRNGRADPHPRWVVVVDQFEQLFTLCVDDQQRRTFIDVLTWIACGRADPGAGADLVGLVVLGVRADFYAACVEYPPLRAALQDAPLVVGPMSEPELREAILFPAQNVGLGIEPGLVEVLLRDLGATTGGSAISGYEAGRLPLLAHALRVSWQQRHGWTLTVAGYRATGGIHWAVAATAEWLFAKLSPAAQYAARSVFLRLVALGGEGHHIEDTRRRVARSDLLRVAADPTAVAAVVDTFTQGRLLTQENDTVEITHEALLRAWPRLRDWLNTDRAGSRVAQELEDTALAWDRNRADTAILFRGSRLESARTWAATHTAGALSAVGSAFLAASVWQQRRTAGLRRAAVLSLVILTVAATTLAAFALQQQSTAQTETTIAQARLRTAASRALADDANRYQSIDPATSLQLAQAAWRAGHTPEAYGALFSQYAGLQSVDKVFENLRPGNIDGVAASSDGSVAIMMKVDKAPVVWTGFTGDHPQSWTPPGAPHARRGSQFDLSPDGRTLVEADVEGGVWLWDVEHRSRPVELATNQPDTLATAYTRMTIAFSQDSTRLVRRLDLQGQAPETSVWDLPHHTLIPTANSIAPDLLAASAFLGPDPNAVVLSTSSATNVYNLASGQLLRSIPRSSDQSTDMVAENGAVLARCSRADNHVHVIDLGTGIEQRSIPVSLCSDPHDLSVDASTDYGLFYQENVDPGSNSYLNAVDLRSGTVYQLAAPDIGWGGPGSAVATDVAVHSGAGHGPPVVLIADLDVVYRVNATGPSMLTGADTRFITDQNIDDEFVDNVSPDGAIAVDYDTTGQLDIIDAKSDTVIARTPAPPEPTSLPFQGNWWAFTPDSKRLLVLEGDSLVVYAVPTPTAPTLVVQGRIDLPMPQGIGRPLPSWPEWAGSVVAIDNASAVVLYAGVFSRWNLDTGRAIGAPLPLHTDILSQRLAAMLAFTSATVRPGHPQQIAVADPNGSVELWDLDQRRIIETVTALATTRNSVAFDSTGENMAVLVSATVTLWDIDHNRQSGQAIPTGYLDGGLLGFTPDHKLVVVSTLSNPGAEIWDPTSGKLITTLTPPSAGRAIRLQSGTLSYWSHELKRSVVLDPAQWFTAVCAAVDRPYTDAEKVILEQDDQASPVPPCH